MYVQYFQYLKMLYDKQKEIELYPISHQHECIGSGGYAVVYKIKNSKGEFCAKKQFHQLTSNQQMQEAVSQARFLISFTHRNIIKGYHYINNKIIAKKHTIWKLTIYMEYFEGKNLQCLINQVPSSLTPEMIDDIYNQLLEGIQFLHSIPGIVHNDLSLKNILYDRISKKLKIIDLGISKKLENRKTRELCKLKTTILYTPPEYAENRISTKSDYWFLGLVMLQLVLKTSFCKEFYYSDICNNQNFPRKHLDKINVEMQKWKYIIEMLMKYNYRQREMIPLKKQEKIIKQVIIPSLQKQQIITKDLILLKMIETSKYGNVFQAKYKKQFCMVKKVPLILFEDRFSWPTLNYLQQNKNPKLVNIIEIIETTDSHKINFVYIVYQALQKQWKSFRQLINEKIKFSQEEIIDILHQISITMNQLNQRKIIHSSLGAKSIFYLNAKNQNFVKIGQIFYSRSLEQNTLYLCKNAKIYRPPEGLDLILTEQCDVWSVGTILYELLFHEQLFLNHQLIKNYSYLQNKKQISEFHLHNDLLRKLFQFMLVKEIQHRYTFSRILNYINNFKFPVVKIQKMNISEAQAILKFKKVESVSEIKARYTQKYKQNIWAKQYQQLKEIILTQENKQKKQAILQIVNHNNYNEVINKVDRLLVLNQFKQVASKNSYIQKILHICNDDKKQKILIVYQHFDTNLRHLIEVIVNNNKNQQKVITPKQKILIMYQIVQGLIFLHENNFYHHNICSANIFIDKKKSDIKIGGLGSIQKKYARQSSLKNIKILYPKSAQYRNKMTDIEQIAIIFYELLTEKICQGFKEISLTLHEYRKKKHEYQDISTAIQEMINKKEHFQLQKFSNKLHEYLSLDRQINEQMVLTKVQSVKTINNKKILFYLKRIEIFKFFIEEFIKSFNSVVRDLSQYSYLHSIRGLELCLLMRMYNQVKFIKDMIQPQTYNKLKQFEDYQINRIKQASQNLNKMKQHVKIIYNSILDNGHDFCIINQAYEQFMKMLDQEEFFLIDDKSISIYKLIINFSKILPEQDYQNQVKIQDIITQLQQLNRNTYRKLIQTYL